MTWVPVSADDVLPDPTPIVGADDAPATVRSYLADVQSSGMMFVRAMHTAQSMLQGMEGRAVQTLHTRTNLLWSSAVTVLWSVEEAWAEFGSFGRTVSNIHSRARSLANDVDEALEAIRGASATIADIVSRLELSVSYTWTQVPPVAMPEPPAASGETDGDPVFTAHEEFRWRDAVLRWERAAAVILTATRDWVALGEERRGAERSLVASLENTELGQLLALQPGATSVQLAQLMTTQLTPDRPWEPVLVQELLSGVLTPEEVANTWETLEQSSIDTDRLLQEYCFELASLDGLPFWAMDRAARAALSFALDTDHLEQLQEAYLRFGFDYLEMDTGLASFSMDLEAIQTALTRAEKSTDDTVQLVSLGRHNDVVTAGISLGDLDTASTIGVFVSGMNSNVRQISDAFDAFSEIRGDTIDMSMLTWIGYDAPGLVEETLQGKADAGSARLASFLDGIASQRADHSPDRFVVIGHSYGTNVAAEALKVTRAHVHDFVTLGSAGLRQGTTFDSLGVNQVHATHAAGDGIASTGQHVHFSPTGESGARVNPSDLEGDHVRTFDSDGANGGKPVTMHNLKHPIDWWGPLQWFADADGTSSADEVGYLHPDSSTVVELQKIMSGAWGKQ